MTIRGRFHHSPAGITTTDNYRPEFLIPDFGALPPEINSANMYSGAGAQPLMAAAQAWDTLAAELESYTAGCSAVLAELQYATWLGEASRAMVNAVTPYLVWAAVATEQVREAASKARAASAAYEAALHATVPPETIATNRAHVAALAAHNLLGQNTPAIAAAESAYADMWAQDSAAMYDYAVSSSEAATFAPFESPPTISCMPTYPGANSSWTRAAYTSDPAQARQASPPTQVDARQRRPHGAPRATITAAASNGLQQWQSLLVNAFGDLNTLLVVPLQLFFALAETAFDTGKYAYTVKAGFPTHTSSPPPAKVSASSGGAQWPSTAPIPPTTLLTSRQPRGSVGDLAVPPGWTAAAQTPASPDHPATPTPPRHPGAWTAANTAPSAAWPASRISSRGPADRGGGTVAFRKRDRRFKMPRPASGG